MKMFCTLKKMNIDYPIDKVESSKDKIKQPLLAQQNVIPKIGSSILIVGKSGSGKSTLLYRLLTSDKFYKGFFKKTFLISPSSSSDDIQKALNLPPENVFSDLTEAITALDSIMKHQQMMIEKHGASKSSQFAVVLDDVIGNTKFLNSPQFTKLFIACRHFGLTVFLCSQHLKRIPRVCRLQASCLYFYAISQSESEVISDEHAPPGVNNKNFMRMIDDNLSKPYAFLTIMLTSPWAERFRVGLANVIDISQYKTII